MNALVGIALSVCITSANPAANPAASGQATSPAQAVRSAADLRQAVERLLAAETAAKSSDVRVAVLREMAALSQEIAAHPTLGKLTAKSFRDRLGGRLKRAEVELKAAAKANGLGKVVKEANAKPPVAAVALRPLDEMVLAQRGGAGGAFDGPPADGAEALADLIQETIDPPGWERNGGLGVIGFFARGGAGGAGAGNGLLAQVPGRGNNLGGGPAQLALDADASAELIDVIQQTVAPQSWDVNGGEGVAIFFAPKGALVIHQTEEVHSGLFDVVNHLRRN
jgi:hypothetical protein